MRKRAVLWCRSETRNNEDLTRQNQVLSFYCKERGIEEVQTILEYGKADIMKLRSFRLMAKYDECDLILIENFEIFGFAPDVAIEEIKYLNENGVKVVSVDEGELTPERLPELYRKQFKVIICNGSCCKRRKVF